LSEPRSFILVIALHSPFEFKALYGTPLMLKKALTLSKNSTPKIKIKTIGTPFVHQELLQPTINGVTNPIKHGGTR